MSYIIIVNKRTEDEKMQSYILKSASKPAVYAQLATITKMGENK